MISKQAALTPLSTAVVCGDRVMSYHELEAQSNRLARKLLNRELSPNTRIAVLLDRSVDLIVTLLGILKAGSAYVPIDPAYPKERLAYVLNNARPAAVISKTASIGSIPEDLHTILLDDLANEPVDLEFGAVNASFPDSVAYVIYTSGSTGVPKGVRIAQRSVTNLLASMRREPGIKANDVLLAVTTISFDIAVLELFLPLTVGAKIVLAREADVADGAALMELMKRHGVTILQATPMTWNLLVESGWSDPNLKMLCGGEALSRRLANQLLVRGGELWNMYGPTETTVWSSVGRVNEGEGPVLIGPPIDNTQFYVLDEQLRPVSGDEPGELFIGGEGVALGYVDLPQMTAQRFISNPFVNTSDRIDAPQLSERIYRTGDIVRCRSNNTYEFLGRSDYQVKIRGYRIELGEIEATLLRHPSVLQAVAIVGENEEKEPVVWAYVMLRSGTNSTSEPMLSTSLRAELQANFNTYLPAYMHPAAIVPLGRFPQTANGKVDRNALPKPIPEPEAPRASNSTPQDVEQRLAAIWRSLLNVGDLDATSNFFMLGGHSLLLMQLLDRIEKDFGVKLTVAALFGAPTLGQQIQLLQRWDDRHYDFRKLVQLNVEGTERPLIVVHNTGVYCYHLAQLLGPTQPVTALQLFDPSSPELLPTSVEAIAAEYVQIIRKMHPAGPYRLIGWCIGGVLAFEIACQLKDLQLEVEFVGLIDAWAPGHFKRLPKARAWLADRSYRAQLIWTDWHKVRAKQQSFGDFLKNRVLVKKLLRLPDQLRDQPLMKMFADRHASGEHYDRWLVGYLDEVASRYTPRVYPGQVLLLRSSREPKGLFLDPLMGWGAFASDGVESAMLDGDHFTVFRGAGLQQLAEILVEKFGSPVGQTENS